MRKEGKARKKLVPIKSDALFKKIMEDVLAAREFLEFYLPVDFKNLLNLAEIRVEKESFVEDGLKKRLSDIIYTQSEKEIATID